MPRSFYILPDDRGWWAISEEPYVAEYGRSYPSHSEALDHLRNLISSKGLVMGQPLPENLGFRVEAFAPGEAGANPRPMLYSAKALKTTESIKERLGQVLKQRALDLAKRNGRNLVSDDDVWEALNSIDMVDVFADSQEEAGDGR